MATAEQTLPRRALPAISTVTFVGFMDTILLVPIMALYAQELGASIGLAGVIVGLYSIANTPANVLFGRLIDRVGHRIPLMSGLVGAAVAMFSYSLCRTPLHLGLVRVFHGISGAVVGPATMSAIAGYFSGEREGRAMGFYGMAIAAANLAGFSLSGIIATRLGYSALFFFGAGLLAVGVAVSSLLPPVRRRPLLMGEAAGGGFARVKALMKRPGLLAAYGSIFAQYFSFGGVVTLLPSYIQGLEMDAFYMGMLLTTFSVVFIAVQFPSGALSDRVGRWLPAMVGLGLGAAGLVLLASQTAFALMALTMALYGVGYGMLFPSVSALVADYTGPEERGLATGIFHALLTAGVAIGAPVMGWAGGALGLRSGLLLAPVALLVALALVLVARQRVREST